jgi:regulator of replication initiation timing
MEYYYEEPQQVTFEDFDMYETSDMYSEHSYDSAPMVDSAPQFKVERVSPSPIQKRRPGRLPARPDEELSPVEFERRERRRERNRHAAARCRVRRLQKVSVLEGQVNELKSSKAQLEQENQNLQKELERLRFQLNMGAPKPAPLTIQPNNTEEKFPAIKALESLQVGAQNYAVTFTPLLLDGTFDFPVLPNEAVVKMRSESVTEFNKILQVV